VVKRGAIIHEENFYSEDLKKEGHFGHMIVDGRLIVKMDLELLLKGVDWIELIMERVSGPLF
jgi:hypothetical protein